MAATMSSNFAAVDLDAVLDDFEHQEACQEGQSAPTSPALNSKEEEEPKKFGRPRLAQRSVELEEPASPQEAGPSQDTPEARSPTPETVDDPEPREPRADLAEPANPVDAGPPPNLGAALAMEDHSVEASAVLPDEAAWTTEADCDPRETMATSPGPTETNKSPDSTASSPSFHSIYDRTASPGEDGPRSDLSLATALGGARPKDTSPLPAAGASAVAEADPPTPIVSPVLPESPPPYSEVDPMNTTPKPVRPSELPISHTHRPEPEATSAQPMTEDDLIPQIPSPEDLSLNVEPPGAPGSTPNHPTANSIDLILHGLTEEQLRLGLDAPTWVPDVEATGCMICASKFTLVRRRHHCRSCGKLLCSACCGEKSPLKHLDDKIGRVCKPCKSVLDRLERFEHLRLAAGNPMDPLDGTLAPPNPNNPMEYCSTVSPLEQAAGQNAVPSVMVPVSVLKRTSIAAASPPIAADVGPVPGHAPGADLKHVMFSDGVRPGGDLTDLDGSNPAATSSGLKRPPSSKRRPGKSSRRNRSTSEVGRCLLPEGDCLPLVRSVGDKDAYQDVNELALKFLPATPAGEPLPLLNGAAATPTTPEEDPHTVRFILNKNLTVRVRSVFYAPVGRTIWNYRSQGLTSVGQDEVVFLLIRNEDECLPPRDIFDQIQSIYEAARGGSPVTNMGYTSILSGKTFLNRTDYGGFLYFKPSFQALSGLDLPSDGRVLFGVLISKWEVPWARVFPLRLKLRLGAHAKYYPAPIWSDRERPTVYRDIGNTIMKLLSDFRNYTYTLPLIRGLMIHTEDKVTSVVIPKDRYRQIQRALLNSNDPVLALGAMFSPKADSHLVAVQAEENESAAGNITSASDYETRTINSLCGERRVTGASFIVFNGALKSSSGLSAKSSIVEDGIMVQVSPERMVEFRKSLERMEDVEIACGPLNSPDSEEMVRVRWVDVDETTNTGIKSLLDGRPLDGLSSIRLHSGRDFISDKSNHFIRWTEVFLLSPPISYDTDPLDPMNVATALAKAVCLTLAPHLKYLLAERQNPLAVRVNLEADNFGYEAGSHGSLFSQEFMNFLDDTLIPMLHGGDLVCGSGRPSLEMVFHILDC